MTKQEQIRKFENWFKNQPIAQTNILKYKWLSGCSTDVYPIEICSTFSMTVQWGSNRRPNKLLEKCVSQFPDLVKNAYFCKSDGSCPSTIEIKFIN